MKRLIVIALLVVGCGGGGAASSEALVSDAPSAAPATAGPSTAPTAGVPPEIADAAVHVVTAIDELTAIMSTGEGLDAWLGREGTYVADNYTTLSSRSALSDYADAMQAALEAFTTDGDVVGTLLAIVALRGDIVPLLPAGAVIPVFTPAPATPVPVKPVRVEGKGEQNTKPFNLAASDYTVLLRGTSPDFDNVILHLVGRDNDYTEYIWNELTEKGKYRYETILYGVPAGSFYLEADLPGNWIVNFTPLE